MNTGLTWVNIKDIEVILFTLFYSSEVIKTKRKIISLQSAIIYNSTFTTKITIMILIGNISYCTAAVIYYGAKNYIEISSQVFILTIVRRSQLHINQSTTYQYLALCNSFVLKYIKYIPNNPSKYLVSLKSTIAIIYPTPKHQKNTIRLNNASTQVTTVPL